MKKYVSLFLILAMIAVSLTACGEKKPNTSGSGSTASAEPIDTAQVDKAKVLEAITTDEIAGETVFIAEDGAIQVGYVEDFSESYYDENELKEFIEDELGSAGKLEAIDTKDGKVRVILSFKDADAYNAYEKEIGSVSVAVITANEAMMSYKATPFHDAKNVAAAMKTGQEVIDADKYQAVVVTGPVNVVTAGKVAWYSQGNLSGERTLTLDDGVTAVILFST